MYLYMYRTRRHYSNLAVTLAGTTLRAMGGQSVWGETPRVSAAASPRACGGDACVLYVDKDRVARPRQQGTAGVRSDGVTVVFRSQLWIRGACSGAARQTQAYDPC